MIRFRNCQNNCFFPKTSSRQTLLETVWHDYLDAFNREEWSKKAGNRDTWKEMGEGLSPAVEHSRLVIKNGHLMVCDNVSHSTPIVSLKPVTILNETSRQSAFVSAKNNKYHLCFVHLHFYEEPREPHHLDTKRESINSLSLSFTYSDFMSRRSQQH